MNLVIWFIRLISVAQYVTGQVLKGHLCPAFQIAFHMQVNLGVYKGSLLMSHATTGTSWG